MHSIGRIRGNAAVILIENIDDQITKLLQKLQDASPASQVGSQIVRTVAFTHMAEMRERIQQKGQSADGGDIGTYSTTPIYVAIDQMVGRKLQPAGKNFNGKRRKVFARGKKAGQPHTSRYFDRGYEGYKTEIGRNMLGKVNLTLSGQLMNQMRIFPTSKGWGTGWTNSQFTDRAYAFHKKYGKTIFGASPAERTRAVKLAAKLTNDAISKNAN